MFDVYTILWCQEILYLHIKINNYFLHSDFHIHGFTIVISERKKDKITD